MGRELSTPLHVARHVLESDKAWLLFVEIPAPGLGDSGGFFRLVKNTRHIVANGATWQATSMEIRIPEENADGDLGSLTIAIPNVSRLPLAYVESQSGQQLLGQIVTVYLQHESQLETFAPGLSWRQRGIRFRANERTAELECGHPAQSQRIPFPVFDRRGFPQLLPTAGSPLGGGS
jgi:hypothetical protein